MNGFRLNAFHATNGKPPGGNRGATVCQPSWPLGATQMSTNTLISHSSGRRVNGAAPMTTYHRSRPEGRMHRTRIRVLLLPTLSVGCRIPSAIRLGYWLRISPSEGYRHMRRVLAEAGIATETRGVGRGRRIYVVDIPAWRAAA